MERYRWRGTQLARGVLNRADKKPGMHWSACGRRKVSYLNCSQRWLGPSEFGVPRSSGPWTPLRECLSVVTYIDQRNIGKFPSLHQRDSTFFHPAVLLGFSFPILHLEDLMIGWRYRG